MKGVWLLQICVRGLWLCCFVLLGAYGVCFIQCKLLNGFTIRGLPTRLGASAACWALGIFRAPYQLSRFQASLKVWGRRFGMVEGLGLRRLLLLLLQLVEFRAKGVGLRV